MTSASMISPGDILTRAEIRPILGGSAYGGICPAIEERNVILYSDHEVAKKFGYHDGWLSENDTLGPIFEYTGAGKSGHQSLTQSGNKAILQHVQSGRTLHVFTRVGKITGTDTKTHRYIGEFAIDEEQPFVPRQGLGEDDLIRTAIVFRLRPTGEFDRSDSDTISPAPSTSAEFVPLTITSDMLEAAAVTRNAFTSSSLRSRSNSASLDAAASGKIAPVQAVNVSEFQRAASAATTVRRRKALLIEAYVNQLEAQGHSVGSFQLQIEGRTTTLRTDFFDATDYTLYEAQGSSDRDAVRAAFSRLLDYRRYVRHDGLQYEPKTVALLPGRPDPDLEALLASYRISLIYQGEDGKFSSAF
ncbi:hypothetical protein [Streptomyces sp. NPDC088554]|uniref:hypothetical protein n=1 Tax=Streptomyces sp. NPDC088554 TaxID=3365865 RepID=UPI0037FAD551